MLTFVRLALREQVAYYGGVGMGFSASSHAVMGIILFLNFSTVSFRRLLDEGRKRSAYILTLIILFIGYNYYHNVYEYYYDNIAKYGLSPPKDEVSFVGVTFWNNPPHLFLAGLYVVAGHSNRSLIAAFFGGALFCIFNGLHILIMNKFGATLRGPLTFFALALIQLYALYKDFPGVLGDIRNELFDNDYEEDEPESAQHSMRPATLYVGAMMVILTVIHVLSAVFRESHFSIVFTQSFVTLSANPYHVASYTFRAMRNAGIFALALFILSASNHSIRAKLAKHVTMYMLFIFLVSQGGVQNIFSAGQFIGHSWGFFITCSAGFFALYADSKND